MAPHDSTSIQAQQGNQEMNELETCDICLELVNYCSCWRCMTCELLRPENIEPGTDENGEDVCSICQH